MSDLPDSSNKRPRWLAAFLSLLPLWLILSAGVAVWWSFHSDDKEEEERNQRFAMEMSVERIADDMRKLVEVIGPRDANHPEALMRAAAMIDGTLGPSNTGYQIQRIPGPGEAPIIRATLKGNNDSTPPYWVIASYDTSPNSADAPASSAVAALIAIAQVMSRDELAPDVHFFFLPCGNSSIIEHEQTVPKLLTQSKSPAAVFYLCGKNALLLGKDLLVFTQTNKSSELDALNGIGEFITKGAMPDSVLGFDYTSGLKSYQVFTTGKETDDPAMPAENIAVSAGKIVEWLRRCSNLAAAK